MADGRFFSGRKVSVDVIDRRRKLARRAAAQVRKALLHRGEVATSDIGLSDNDVCSEHDVRVVELLGRPEKGAVDAKRFGQVSGREVRSEGEWKSKERGELCGVETRAQQPDRDVEARAGHGTNFLP